MTGEKVAVLIAAGSGMGADAARRLAADGFAVAILSSSGRGAELGQELGGFGLTGSNREPQDIARVIDMAEEHWGRIDVLVNSAGHGPAGALADLSDADWHDALDIYLLNVIRAAQAAAPVMAQGGGGSIINISTFAVFEPDPDFPTSGVMRAGLAHYAKLFSNEYAGRNIRMNNVLPGFIDSFPETPERTARVPLGRYGRVEEVSSLVAWLASDASGYMTGQNLRLDGGLTRAL